MAERTGGNDIKERRPLGEEGRAAYEDEARIGAFRANRLGTPTGVCRSPVVLARLPTGTRR